MPSFIEDLWIISKDGIPLVEIFNNTELDGSYLGAFLAALETFSKQLSGDELKSITMGANKLIITPALNHNIYLVSQCDAKIKNKKLNKMFKILTDFFEELYTVDDITKWDGDIALFDKYKERIDIYFQMYDL